MLSFQPAYLWVDLQLTGLDPFTDTILEFACILSNQKFTEFEQGPHIIIHCDEEKLGKMNQWNTQHHTASGLYKACLQSQTTLEQAQTQILTYLQKPPIPPSHLKLAGNSIHMDKLFLLHRMPKLHAFLHYQILDVTSIKLVVNTVKPQLFYKKKNGHRAVQDIRESIGELQFYLQYCFGA